MEVESMSRTRFRAWLSALIWSVAGAGFALTFFAGGGPGGFPADSNRHLLGAVFLGFAFLAYWVTLWLTRQRAGAPAAFDERDLAVVARSNQVALVVVLVGVFGLAIGLWTVYEPAGSVPAGWMWFLAYGSVILAFVTSSLTTLLVDRRMSGHA